MQKELGGNEYGNFYRVYDYYCTYNSYLYLHDGKMKYTIMLKLDTWNEIIGRCRANKYLANSYKQTEMQDISWFIRQIPKIEKYPIELVFTWHIRNPRSDLDNKSIKSILDEMQNLGILENDNVKHIRKITHEAVIDKNEYVEMEIIC